MHARLFRLRCCASRNGARSVCVTQPFAAVQDIVASKVEAMQAELKRAEVLVLQARQEKEQADSLLKHKHGAGER